MAVGIVFTGMLFGAAGAAAALVAGASIWWALALYSGLGTLAALGAVVILLRNPSERSDPAPDRKFMPLGG